MSDQESHYSKREMQRRILNSLFRPLCKEAARARLPHTFIKRGKILILNKINKTNKKRIILSHSFLFWVFLFWFVFFACIFFQGQFGSLVYKKSKCLNQTIWKSMQMLRINFWIPGKFWPWEQIPKRLTTTRCKKEIVTWQTSYLFSNI